MHPALAVLLGLLCALLLPRWRVPLGLAFLIGAAAMGLSAGLAPAVVGAGFWGVMIDPATWIFVVQVTLVFVLSTVMRLVGSLDVLVGSAGALIKNRRARLASLPALVGLLPMPGGAVVSAPMIDRTRCSVALLPLDKNLINYWYRHIWEVCWPLYPPLLLAATFLPDRDTTKLCLIQVPLMAALLILGWLFILRRVPGGEDGSRDDAPDTGFLFSALLPLVVAIGGMPVIGTILERSFPGSDVGGIGLVLSLAAGLVCALLQNGFRHLASALAEPKVWSLLVLAFAVKIFGGLVGVTGAGVATADLVRLGGLPPILVVIVLPMFIGFVSGATIAMVTVSFPVVVALVGGGADAESLLPWLMLAYAMGFVGYMLSPVHLCLLLSSRFFGEVLSRSYRPLVPPLLLFVVASGLLFLAYRSLGS
jgi:integral membrane protein (TIGR00529 family)